MARACDRLEFVADSDWTAGCEDFYHARSLDTDDWLRSAASVPPQPHMPPNNSDSGDAWADKFGRHPSEGNFDNQEQFHPLDYWIGKDKAECWAHWKLLASGSQVSPSKVVLRGRGVFF